MRINGARLILGAILLFTIPTLVADNCGAQFTPGILSNDSYWSDGRAEFDIYDAQLMRAGQLRHCEVLHIFLRERIDPKTLARVDDAKRTDVTSAIRMQQIWTAPIGMLVEQGSLTGYWRIDSASLAHLNFVGTDCFGNVLRRVQEKRDGNSASWTLTCDSYREPPASLPISPPANATFYDELPLRVRTIDFRKPAAEFEVSLAPSLVNVGKVEDVQFAPAKVSWKPAQKNIEVLVQQAKGSDRFLLDREFPFLLREWQMADGSKLKMKRGVKADYWNYNKNGDRERALNNPMLQHPD